MLLPPTFRLDARDRDLVIFSVIANSTAHIRNCQSMVSREQDSGGWVVLDTYAYDLLLPIDYILGKDEFSVLFKLGKYITKK